MFEIKYLKQGIDGFESYLRVDNDQWVRLDFLLEFYLTGDVKISKEFKGRIKSYLENVEYATSLLPEIRSKIFEKSFNYAEFMKWNSNMNETQIALEKIR